MEASAWFNKQPRRLLTSPVKLKKENGGIGLVNIRDSRIPQPGIQLSNDCGDIGTCHCFLQMLQQPWRTDISSLRKIKRSRVWESKWSLHPQSIGQEVWDSELSQMVSPQEQSAGQLAAVSPQVTSHKPFSLQTSVTVSGVVTVGVLVYRVV